MALACVPCRKSKRKCDTSKPKCMQCSLRGKQCSYDVVEDKRRISYKEVEDLRRLNQVQREIINSISKGGSTSEALIKRIQEDKNFLETFINGDHGLGDNIDLNDNLLTTDSQGRVSYYGETSNFPMINNNPILPNSDNEYLNNSNYNPYQTLHISEDLSLELLNLYFCWQHPYFNIFDKALFLRDFSTGGRFFSTFLFATILSHAAHLYKDVDPVNAGNLYYEAALQMLPAELETPSITTVQGLLLLASKESGVGKINLGWSHSGLAFRIAIALGLHLDSSKLRRTGLISEEDDAVRYSTFWGCYLFDQGWSFYLGRPNAIEERNIALSFPTYCVEEPEDWTPFYEEAYQEDLIIKYYPKNTLAAIVHLYRILKNIIIDIYSDNSNKKDYGMLLNRHYQELNSWNETLPHILARSNDHPAIIMLHTMYFTTMIFLFRPFFRHGGKDWKYSSIPDPVEISRDSASHIIDLLQKYKKLYNLRKIVNLASYVVSTASTVYLALDGASSSGLTTCQAMFLDLCSSWPDAKIILETINNCIKKDGGENNEEINLDQFLDMGDFMFGDSFYVDWDI